MGGAKPQRDGNVFFVLYGNNGPGAERTSQASMVQLVALLPPDRRLASSIPYGGTFVFSSVHWAHDVLEQLKVNFFRVNDIYLRHTSDKYSSLNTPF